VGFGKQRPGKPKDSLISEVQMVIATCWKEKANKRMTPLDLHVILSSSKAVLVKDGRQGGKGKEIGGRGDGRRRR